MIDVAYIALGSNLGDRLAFLSLGRAELAALPESRLVGESSIEETDPLDDVDQPRYLNQMIALSTSLSPHDLLAHLHTIESRAGRTRHGRWASRTLDLDIVCFDRQTVDDGELRVPHPELENRPFWKRELAQLRSPIERRAHGALAADEPILPGWARVSERRRKHIARVIEMLMQWAETIGIQADERKAWFEAGLWHDALRDAPEAQLRALSGETEREAELLHGPAAAALLESKGEGSPGVLAAIRYHTVGSPDWDRTGRALYMADFLEPGRNFLPRDRAFLAAQVPHDFDGVFRQVLRTRLEHALRQGYTLFPETVSLWNAVR